MLDLDYGSDSDDDSGTPTVQQSANPAHSGTIAKSKLALGLPPPTNRDSKSPSSLASTLPKPKKVTGQKKIILELPKLSKRTSDDEDDENDDGDRPPAKKTRLGGGGGSSLLSMLPAPKKSSLQLPAPQRVLGGGKPGVVYSGNKKTQADVPEEDGANPSDGGDQPDKTVHDSEEHNEKESTATMIPPSMLLKGKTKSSQQHGNSKATTSSVATSGSDFFSLGM